MNIEKKYATNSAEAVFRLAWSLDHEWATDGPVGMGEYLAGLGHQEEPSDRFFLWLSNYFQKLDEEYKSIHGRIPMRGIRPKNSEEMTKHTSTTGRIQWEAGDSGDDDTLTIKIMRPSTHRCEGINVCGAHLKWSPNSKDRKPIMTAWGPENSIWKTPEVPMLVRHYAELVSLVAVLFSENDEGAKCLLEKAGLAPIDEKESDKLEAESCRIRANRLREEADKLDTEADNLNSK